MAVKNRYSLEDIHDLMSIENSPLEEFREYPTGNKEAQPVTVWYLLHGRWDDALQMLLEDNYTVFPCCGRIKEILFIDFEDVPFHLERPAGCVAGHPEEGRNVPLMRDSCDICPCVAKWRLERGL